MKNQFQSVFQHLGYSILTLLLMLVTFSLTAQTVKKYDNLEEALVSPLSVEWLDLTDQNLQTIPALVYSFKNLKYLNLNGNPIRIIPEDVSKLSNLQTLYINNNPFLDVQRSMTALGLLPQLQELHLENDNIEAIPSHFADLKQLKYLDLSGNPIRSIPKEISALTNLEVLVLRDDNELNINESLESLSELPMLKIVQTNFGEHHRLRRPLGEGAYFEKAYFHTILFGEEKEGFRLKHGMQMESMKELYPPTLIIKTSNQR